MNFDLKSKVAIVTGGNGGIGLGMARGLARAGATVMVAARDAGKSAEAVRELRALGSDAFAVDVDVSDEASVAAMVATTVERYGRLDILINNAGMSIRKPVQELALDEWHQVIDTNMTAAFLSARAASAIQARPAPTPDQRCCGDPIGASPPGDSGLPSVSTRRAPPSTRAIWRRRWPPPRRPCGRRTKRRRRALSR